MHQAQRARQLPCRGPRVALVRAVRLVDGDHVGQLQDALLDALQLVAGAGQRQQQEGVDHLGDRRLGLADTYGLDQDHVVARRLHHHHRLPGGLRDPAQRARAGGGADEGRRVDRQAFHPGLVAQDGAARAGGGRVDGEDRHPVPQRGQHRAERVDERRLADTRHPADADAPRPAAVRQQLGEQLLCQRPVLRPGGLDERDGAGHQGPLPVEHTLHIGVQIDRGHRGPTARGRGRPTGASPGRGRRPGSPSPAGTPPPRPSPAGSARPAAGSPRRPRS